MKKLLIGNILSQMWAVEPAYANAQLTLLINMLNGNTSDEDFSEKRAALRSYAYNIDSKTTGEFKSAAPRSIAVIDLSGPLMKNDQWCGPEGTATKVAYLQEAMSNPNILGVIIKGDSPGGTVDGTETLSNKIKEVSKVKPVVGYVDGMAASACYWAISACDTIILNGETAIVGSIGTVSSFFDFSTALEKAGVKIHEIYAEAAFSKNLEFREAIKGNYKPMQDNVLKPLNNVFVSAVKENRKGKLDLENDRVLSGGTFFGNDAIKVGLADEIGSFEKAIDRTIELADNPSAKNNSTQNTMKITFQSVWTALKNRFGQDAPADAKTFEKELAQADWAQINSDLVAHDQLKADNELLVSSNNKLKQDLTASQSQVEALTSENLALKGTAVSTEPVIKGTETPAVELPAANDEFLTEFDREAQAQYEKENPK